jgi:SAM-dependent methyltransferase
MIFTKVKNLQKNISMTKRPITIDPIWEKKYAAGDFQMYPWDSVVTFVYRNMPKDCPRANIKILEVGFGSGPNLWFAAREGFDVSGIEGSPSAVRFAKKRFTQDGLKGDLRVGDFTSLPFQEESFDLVIDRGSLVCVNAESQKKAVSEIYRCLKKGGRFLHNAYGDSHTSMLTGEQGLDGLTLNISGGTLTGVGQLHFTSRSEIDKRFSEGWRFHKVERLERVNMLGKSTELHSEWLVIAEKI